MSKKGINLGETNGMWKGDEAGNDALHKWVKKRKIKPYLCVICGRNPPYDLANKSGKYKRDLNDWEWLCRRCHMVKDGRLKRLIANYNKCFENRGNQYTLRCPLCGKLSLRKDIEDLDCCLNCDHIRGDVADQE